MAKGFEVAGCRRSRICVSAHRKPLKNADAMIKPKPSALNAVSPATIMITPTVMVAIMTMSLQLGVSRRKMKANRRTNANADDLHIVKKVRDINLRDMLPRPMSSEVAAPQGSRRVTQKYLVMIGFGVDSVVGEANCGVDGF